MSKYWSNIVNKLTPYVPGEQPKQSKLIKINTNENPFGPSPKVVAAIKNEIGMDLRLYPDPNSEKLKQAIAQYHDIEESCVFVGNGSDEILAHTFNALLKHDKPILIPDISYSFYPVYCRLYEIEFEQVPLADDLSIDVEDYKRPNGGIIIANPNAPTGLLLPLKAIEALVKSNPNSVVVIDEAYIDFGGNTAIPLTRRYDNLLVVQTLSKSRSLAGLRVGFAVGNKQLIEGLERVKNSFNSYPLARMTISGAVAAIEDEEYFQQTRAAVLATRDLLQDELSKLGFEVLPSAANFVFASHPKYEAKALALALREQSIIVRHFEMARISQYLRISIGSDDEINTLIDTLKKIVTAS